MKTRKQRAATSHVTRSAQIRSWSTHHAGCLNDSLFRLLRTPLSSMLTMAVLGIALALPGGLYVLSQNLLSLSKHWDTDSQLTLYLNLNISDQAGLELANQLDLDPRFSEVKFLDKSGALDEFRQMTTFQNALEHIGENPLPAVILVTPAGSLPAKELDSVRAELLEKPQVELVQLDLEWIKRLRGITEIIQYTVVIIAFLLAFAVVLVVGNTIRLEIENRRDEIIITKLFGATHAYIRRPFLYDGLWFGIIGGLFASLLIMAALWLLNGPVTSLISLYDSSFKPFYPDLLFIVSTALLGALLGYIGAWSAVSQHLYKIEPE